MSDHILWQMLNSKSVQFMVIQCKYIRGSIHYNNDRYSIFQTKQISTFLQTSDFKSSTLHIQIECVGQLANITSISKLLEKSWTKNCMPSTHLPPSSSAGLVVHCAERNDNVSSSQGPSRSRQEEILMENKVWNVDTNLADPQQCFTFTSATRCQGFNYLFSPLRYMDVFREFQVMRGEDGDGESMFEWTWQVCIELTGMAHLSDLPLLPGTLSSLCSSH